MTLEYRKPQPRASPALGRRPGLLARGKDSGFFGGPTAFHQRRRVLLPRHTHLGTETAADRATKDGFVCFREMGQRVRSAREWRPTRLPLWAAGKVHIGYGGLFPTNTRSCFPSGYGTRCPCPSRAPRAH
ncbi:hypothetical protein GCM10010206_63800 [Streptomyces cinerochromogenes]|nr:hypothetical protein GCM10010206_63800 [Streptomyces cinerochromogenes]